jgi:hypothetical protein
MASFLTDEPPEKILQYKQALQEIFLPAKLTAEPAIIYDTKRYSANDEAAI